MMSPRVPSLQIQAAMVCAGALLGATQVVILRRGLALSGGDETVFGLTLAIWLLTIACGGALGSRFTAIAGRRGISLRAAPLAVGLILLSLSACAAPMILHLMAAAMDWIPGTVAGGGGLLLPLIASILIVGLSGGALFSLGCAALSAASGSPITLAYLLEAAGTFLGGMATILIFLPHVAGISLLIIFAVIALLLSISVFCRRLLAAIMSLAVLLTGLLFLAKVTAVETHLASRLHPGQRLLKSLETPYGLLEVYDNGVQRAVYENGLLLATSDDPATAEERAHLALAQHPAPKTVLWIGGYLGGAVREALRHPSLRRLEIIELNPAIFDLAGLIGENQQAQDVQDTRLHRISADGRTFLQGCAPGAYDLILLNLPGPRTARLSKFYTIEGFRLAQRALTPGGALVFFIESSEDFIGPNLASLLKSLEATLVGVFPQTAILPGGNAIFIAGDLESRLALDADTIVSRLHSRGIEPIYWDRYRLRDRLSLSRMDMLEQALQNTPPARLNRDLQPISFQTQQILWAQQLSGGWAGIWTAAKDYLLPLNWTLFLAGALAAIILSWRSRSGLVIAAGGAVFFVGLSGIALEILALVQYQVHFGSGYREVGMLTGLYMLGLGAGSFFTMRIKSQQFKVLVAIQATWLVLPLLLLALAGGYLGSASGLQRLFYILYLLILGTLGGMHFTLATHFFGGNSPSRAGELYALDLVGAVLGAILFGLFALPVLGLRISVLQLALLNLPPFLLLIRLRASAQHL